MLAIVSTFLTACAPETEPEPDPVDTSVPEEDTGCDAVTWYADEDGDGDGDAANSVESCQPIEGHVISGGDCDDSDPGIGPELDEVCGDEVDNDCDGETDEASDGCEDAPDYAALSVEDGLASIVTEVEGVGFSDDFDVADQNGDGVHDVVIYLRTSAEYTERVHYFDGTELGLETPLSDSTHMFGEMRGGNALFVPDRDGDGQLDLLINAAHGDFQDYPYPEFYFADSSGWVEREVDPVHQYGLAVPTGDWSGFGEYFMSVQGDMDGDGMPELAVGDIWDSDGGHHAGAVTVFFGAWDYQAGVAKVLGDSSEDYLIGRRGDIGDFDGDGVDDLVVSGSYDYGTIRGAVCIHLGGFLAYGDEVLDAGNCNGVYGTEDEPLGTYYFTALPDLDGDGAQELAAQSEAGVYLLSGADVTAGWSSTVTLIPGEDPHIEPRVTGDGGPWSAFLYGELTPVAGATGTDSIDLAAVGFLEDQHALFLFDVQEVWDTGPVRALDAHAVWLSDESIDAVGGFGDFDQDGKTDLIVSGATDDARGKLTVLASP